VAPRRLEQFVIARRLPFSLFLLLTNLSATIASAQVSALSASAPRGIGAAAAAPRFAHSKQIRIVYDRATDSTRLSVVTHPGLYFVTWQRPRLTWSVSHAGQTAGASSGTQSVELEFRTQTPQVPTDNRLVVTYGGVGLVEATSLWANTVPGMITNSTFMHFRIPLDQLAAAVADGRVELSVGGVRAKFDPDQLEALRDLLSRVSAPPSPVTGQG
jgi:hypothetical protein